MNQKRVGIIISYINLVLGMCVNIIITPMLISSLGDVDYSIYKIMQSFASPLTMFHLGISTVVTRTIVQYSSQSITKDEKDNSFAHALLVSMVMAGFVLLLGVLLYVFIPVIYAKTMDQSSMKIGRTVFILFASSSIIHMLTDAFSGCLIGNEKYVLSSTITTAKTVIKLALILLLLKLGASVVLVVAIDLFISIGVFCFSCCYSIWILRERPRLLYIDKKLLLSILSFGLAIFLQAVVNQVNNNLDTMILGAFVEEKHIITMYSSALAIYAVYNSLISALTHFFLPKATRLILQNANGKELTDFVIVPGRYQAIIAIGCICGFALFGRNFISIWIGTKYLDAYWIALMLMIPVTIPLVENAALSILDASMKRMYRSVVLVLMAVINIIITIALVQMLGFWGAAIGTVVSLIVGHGLLMNLYYRKTYKMEIMRLFFEIFKGILPAGLVAAALCIPIAFFLENNTWCFVIKCLLFCSIYFGLLWFIGLNKTEKQTIAKSFRKIVLRNKDT